MANRFFAYDYDGVILKKKEYNKKNATIDPKTIPMIAPSDNPDVVVSGPGSGPGGSTLDVFNIKDALIGVSPLGWY